MLDGWAMVVGLGWMVVLRQVGVLSQVAVLRQVVALGELVGMIIFLMNSVAIVLLNAFLVDDTALLNGTVGLLKWTVWGLILIALAQLRAVVLLPLRRKRWYVVVYFFQSIGEMLIDVPLVQPCSGGGHKGIPGQIFSSLVPLRGTQQVGAD